MELANNKKISNIKFVSACFSSELAYGTILYGTLLYNSNNRFFYIEDIFSYKGTSFDKMNWGDKLTSRTLIKASPKPTITSKRV